VTLEIVGSDGKLVRRYSSSDEVFKARSGDDYRSAVLVPEMTPLSTAPGMHRFTWDVHYQPLDGGGRLGGPTLPIAAIGHNTVPAPTTPWVNPGTFTVKLTVNGKTYTQPIVVKPDPRVKTPALVMQQIYRLSKAAYYGALDAQEAASQVRKVAGELAVLRPRVTGGRGRVAGDPRGSHRSARAGS
jgi:hypothetical protein